VVRAARESGMDSHRLAQCESFDALLAILDCWINPGDVLLVKGSRGMCMERVLEWLHQHKEQIVTKHTTREQSRACA
jgi:UDP-N-acetylmuramoyl-tripeptide--D-alanyl-D-alanine ligase